MESPTANCSGFKQHQRMLIGLLGAACSILSFLACWLLVLLMIIFKKYHFTMQRLFLYLTISIMADAFVRILMGVGYNVLFTSMSYCVAVAFLSQYFAMSILLSVLSIVFELFLRLTLNRESGRLEWLYIPVIFLLPALTAWIPIPFDSYQANVSSCSITLIINTTTCRDEPTGIILDYLLWWIPVSLTILISSIAYVVFIAFFSKRKKDYSALVDPKKNWTFNKTMKDLYYLRYIPPVLLTFNLLLMAAQIQMIINPRHPIFILWVLDAIVRGLQGGLLAIFIIMDPKTRQRLTWNQLKVAFLQGFCRREPTEVYPILEGSSDSLRISY